MSEFDVGGSVPTDGNWFSFSKVRETQAHGNIDFDPGEIAASPFNMRLRSVNGHQVFSDEVFWAAGNDGRKTLATNVIAHTRFTIDARGSQGHDGYVVGSPVRRGISGPQV
jgi:hypothetical protein